MQLNGDTYEKGFFRTRDQRYTRTMKLQLKVGGCTVRAAFSHIPFWQSAIWMGQQIVMKPCQGNIATGGSVVEQMDKVRLLYALPHLAMFRLELCSPAGCSNLLHTWLTGEIVT